MADFDRQHSMHDRARRPASDIELATELARPGGHARNADARRQHAAIALIFGMQAAAVIRNDDMKPIGKAPQIDRRPGGGSVSVHIGQ